MARAKVVLRGAGSFQTPGGELWERGKPKTITNPGEIDYYLANTEFTVTMLAEPKKQASSEGGEEPKTHVLTESYLNSINKITVVEIAQGMGLTGEGTKAELIAAILEVQQQG